MEVLTLDQVQKKMLARMAELAVALDLDSSNLVICAQSADAEAMCRLAGLSEWDIRSAVIEARIAHRAILEY